MRLVLINLRPYRALLVVALVLLLAWTAGAVDLSLVAVAAAQPAIQGSWGSGTGQLGVGHDALGRNQGPSALALDARGRVYIADTHNCRVVRYERDGVLDGSWEIRLEGGLHPVDLAVDGGGRVFVAVSEDLSVLRFGPGGLYEGRVELPQTGAGDADRPGAAHWALAGLWADPRSGFHVMMTFQTPSQLGARIVRFDKDGRMAGEEAAWDLEAAGQDTAGRDTQGGPSAVLPQGFCVGSRGELMVAFRDGPFDARIERLGTGGKAVWTQDVTGESLVRASWLLGGDAGGAYLALDYGKTAEIVFVPSKGSPAKRVVIPEFRPRTDMRSEIAPYSAVPGRVSAGGQLYLVTSTEDRFSIQCLTVRSVPRWRWWGENEVPEVCLCR